MPDKLRRVLCASVLVVLGACARQEASPPYVDINVGRGDVGFITYSYQVIQFDLDESRLALAKSSNPEVRDVASYLIETAGEYRGMIDPAADRAGIQSPNQLSTDLQARLDRASALSGVDFDRAYIADQIASHEEAFRHATGMIGETRDPDLNALLRRSTVQLQISLARLRAIQQRIG